MSALQEAILISQAFYGTIAAGGIFSCASHSYNAQELSRQIDQGQATVLVVSEDLVNVAVEAAKLSKLSLDKVLVLRSDPGNWSLKSVNGKDHWTTQKLTWERITDPEVLDNSIINLLYSSGTTGVPKGTYFISRGASARANDGQLCDCHTP